MLYYSEGAVDGTNRMALLQYNFKCPNGNCEKSIIIKWFAPLEYFNQL
jgi:hypothetical protein